MTRLELRECFLACPYCGETVSMLVDTSIERQDYTEDCEVCCQPIVVAITVGEDGPDVVARRSDD